MKSIVMILVALLGVVAPLRADDRLPETEPPVTVEAGHGRMDPSAAPLPLLSRVAGIGPGGAVRIGAARAARVPLGREEVARLAGVSVDDLDERLAFTETGGASAGARFRLEQRRGGWRDTRAVEARAGPFAAGFVTERDAGEGPWNDLQVGGASWNGGRWNGVAGDMDVRLGSGLLVGTHESFGSPSSLSPFPSTRLVRYRSRMESRAHRGAGVRVRWRGEWTAVVTATRRDARVDDNGFVSSYDDAGLHETPDEVERKDRSGERIAALRYEAGSPSARFGVTLASARYDPPLGGGDLTRKPGAFRGSRLVAEAIDVRVARGLFLAEGEGGLSSSGGGSGRALLRVGGRRAKALVRLRHFDARFHAPRSAAYHRIGSEPSGETGAIVIAEARAAGGVLRARYHRYASTDRTWTSAGPVVGEEASLRAERRLAGILWTAGGGTSWRSELRSGGRARGGSAALAAGAVIARGAWRLRADGRAAASRSPSSDAVRRGRGVSVLVAYRGRPGTTFGLAVTALGEADRVLLFPSTGLPGSSPAAWFGGGHERGGVRFAASRAIGRFHVSLAAGPGGFGIDVAAAAWGD